jgi:LmbE family N-acetylglucosaminyl deacetylase
VTSVTAEALESTLARLREAVGPEHVLTGTEEHGLGAAPEHRRRADALKAAVDPNQVLAPGRYGIGLDGS